jgi:hypothetical protein
VKGFVIVSKFWTNMFSAGRAVAVTVFPFIFVSSQSLISDYVLLQHERIHIRQALELAVLPFYVWYLLEFIVRYCRCGNFQKAYRSISFEQEAYAHETEPHYLERRQCWAFLNYFKTS